MPTRSVRLRAQLLTDSTPLAGKTVQFFYRVTGTTEWSSIGTDTTGSDGYAQVETSLTVPQTYDFRAYFAGDAEYESSEAVVTAYTVKARTTLTLTVTPL